MNNTTEQSSKHQDLDKKGTEELLRGINEEDKKVAEAVEQAIGSISQVVDVAFDRLSNGGRLFYIGAGTSGRLGILDASECPPTFGVDHELVTGIIAGGDGAIRKAVENAEDDTEQAWKDLLEKGISSKDCLIGIAASGTTPYVLGGIESAKSNGVITACVVCNEGSPIAQACDLPIEVVVGPEFLTGSTRMKAGTAQKMALNMITTSVMIKLGKVRGNQMVDMRLSNDKLVERAVRMVVNETGIPRKTALELLEKYGSVRAAIDQASASLD